MFPKGMDVNEINKIETVITLAMVYTAQYIKCIQTYYLI